MNVGLNVHAVVVDNVEDEMALMVVGADVASVYRDIVSDKRVGHDPLLQPKIFGRVTDIEGAYSGFEFLAVAAGMQRAPDVVMAEDRKSRDGVTDYIIGLPQSLGPQEIIGHGYQGLQGTGHPTALGSGKDEALSLREGRQPPQAACGSLRVLPLSPAP